MATREARRQANFIASRSTAEIAKHYGVSRRSAQRYKTGERKPSQKTQAKLPKSTPRKPRATGKGRPAYKGKDKAVSHDKRKTKNTATEVKNKSNLKKEGRGNVVKMRAVYDFSDSDKYAGDPRNGKMRTVSFRLDAEEREELEKLLEAAEEKDVVQDVAVWVIGTRSAGFMTDGKVKAVQFIEIL